MNEVSAASVTSASEAAASDLQADAGNTIVVCAPMKLHIGVFFDGTGNNTENSNTGGSGGSYANARSNVSLLAELYKSGSAHDVMNSCGTVGTKYAALYVQGIGTITGLPYQIGVVGLATGMGMTGVERRVYSACIKIGEMIKLLSGGIEPREIVLDVFGFSRGAAAARYFVNCFRQGFINYTMYYVLPFRAKVPKDRNIRIGFIGIFDTVAAIGDGSDEDNGDVNLHISTAQAKDIYHLTAKHEYRTNFRLNHNQPGGGATRELLGAHSDVGGGYRDNGDRTRVEKSETKSYPTRAEAEAAHARYRAAAARARAAQESFWARNGWIRPNEPTGGLNNEPSAIRMVTYHTRTRVTFSYTFTTGAIMDRPWVRIGLSRIALRIMYDRAVAAGVPFLSFPTGGQFAIPEPLRALAGAYSTGGPLPSAANQREILRNYAHISANFDSTGMSPLPGTAGQELWHRVIYPNKPGLAK